MNRTTAFLACLTLVFSVARAEPPVEKPAKATAFPTFGVAFELPGGWTEIPREKSGRVGQWIGPDSQPTKMKSLIMIETGRPGTIGPDLIAKNLARNFGGVVMDDTTTLGGEKAYVVRAENHDDELAPVFALVAIHDVNVYLVMGGAVKDRDVRTEIETIRKSWKWTPVEKPASHLGFRPSPLAIFDGSVTMNVPALMHSVAADEPDTQLDLSLYNLTRNNSDFRATLTLTTLMPGETFEQAKERFIAELAAGQKFTKAKPSWKEAKGVTPRVVTPAVEAERPQPADTDTLHHQWAVISLGEKSGKAVLAHFTHEAETEEERHQYEQAVEGIVSSIATVEKSVEKAVEKKMEK